jgi:class 3 adenylate cyclase/tetratricopeptide (TPR) repeat protein
VAVCTSCGRESPDDFGFCPSCGAALAAAPRPREVRKVVTILFCDLTGSTAIGDRTDPEPLRALMNRYYDGARIVLERHGGTVEKFVGDAVMAVFGIPLSSEDDALRAVRAAVELLEGVHALGLEARVGVNTGEVVSGEGDTLVTGDAVNVTARLEQAAGAGSILLGEETVRLVRDAVVTEPVELVLKGKPEPVIAHRLLSLDREAAGRARRLDRPLVGRRRERARLAADFADAVAERTCRLFTLIGPAGVGKSRLVADFLGQIGSEARVARGRALSYGEGITYWPLVELLIELGLEPDEAIRSSPADTQLATRALLEDLAATVPLVLVLDDLQWAEEPLLDLVEHLADWVREAPIFLLCIARPELLDARPGWGGGKLNATSILLEPLPAGDAAALVDELLAGRDLGAATRARILAAAEGNPLFLEEMAALAREAGAGVEVPGTIQALLQARLDTLHADERIVIERGAVEGKVFHRGAVAALAPEAPPVDVAGRLLSLVRKELVRPDRALVAGEDAFRFRHLLIRDTAYEALPKGVRAELHERFAEWLDGHGELLEQRELVGYHLEQAARYRRELDRNDAAAAVLAERAAEYLGSAGIAAFEREDFHATRSLLERVLALAPADVTRRRLIPELVYALFELRPPDVDARVSVLIAELALGGERDQAVATALRGLADPSILLLPDFMAQLAEAQSRLDATRDPLGVALCEYVRALAHWSACRAGDAHRSYRRAYTVLRDAGRTSLQRSLVKDILASGVLGGMAVADVHALIEELHDEVEDAGPVFGATVRGLRARIDFGAGLISRDEATAAVEEEIAALRQTGAEAAAFTAADFTTVNVPWLEREPEAVERGARERTREAQRLGLNFYYANFLAEWAIALCDLGEREQALAAVAEARATAAEDDVADQIVIDAAEAYARALGGECDAPTALLDRARKRASGIDLTVVSARLDHTAATILALLGEVDRARELLGSLAADTEARGLHRWAARYRHDLDALG